VVELGASDMSVETGQGLQGAAVVIQAMVVGVVEMVSAV
jgi:hypothetical protein